MTDQRNQIYFHQTTTQNEHGEVIEQQKKEVVKVPKTPEFVMLFANTLGALENLDKTCSNVLFGLLSNKLVSRENLVAIDKNARIYLSNKLGLKADTVRRAIKKLQNKKIIFEDEEGLTRLNPELFGKGDWSDTYKLRLQQSYEFDFQKNEMVKHRQIERIDKNAIGMNMDNVDVVNTEISKNGNELLIEVEDTTDFALSKNGIKLAAIFGEETVKTMSEEKINMTLQMMAIK